MERITTLAGADKSERSFLPIAGPIAWFFASSVISIFVAAAALATTLAPISPPPPKSGYTVYASKPLVLGSATDALEQIDARAERLDQFFNKHGCPLAGKGGAFVKYADENGIPYWLVAAIAFQESSCGKQTPELNGKESYNAWG